MRHPSGSGTTGAAPSDVVVVLAAASLVLALLWPTWTARAFRSTVDGAIADVDAVGTVARLTRESTGQWPTAAPPGETPPELAGLSARDSVFARAAYTLQWTQLQVVDSIPAPPDTGPAPADAPRAAARPTLLPIVGRIGGIAVHTGDADLLAELYAHYGSEGSFVLDTVFVLVLPERAERRIGAR